ncbi:MAG TPA: SLBB domain-containing protein, partial [Limnochordia bacterium]
EGDVLVVPERPPVTGLGAELRPGVDEARSGARLSDVLAAAGGPSERADLSRVRVYGPSEDGGARPRSGSDPSEAQGPLIYEGAAATGPVLSGGEVVVVPETRWVDWTKVFAFLAGLKVLKDLIGL